MPHTPNLIVRPDVPPDEVRDFQNHICPPTFGGGPLDVLPGEVPDQLLARDLLRSFELPLPQAVAAIVNARNNTSLTTLPMWVIEDPNDPVAPLQFPSAPIRTRQGQVIYVETGFHVNTHTIHWHGIEPGPGNDGVGKHSWEVSGNFVYRFQTNSPGTFFYHCHKNTTLHFEMGLYGALIVDPDVLGAPFAFGGPGRYKSVTAAGIPNFDTGTQTFPYNVEQIWAVDDMDSLWHIELENAHDAFMQKCDGLMQPESFSQGGFLHDFRPDVFTIGAVVSVPGQRIDDPRAAIFANAGEVVLLRVICASYITQEFVLPMDAVVVGMDGHPLGVPPYDKYSFPFVQPAGEPGAFRLTSARRRDLVFLPTAANAGDNEITIRYRHPITLAVLHEARVLFRVNGVAPPQPDFAATAQFNPRNRRLQVRTNPAQPNASLKVFAAGVPDPLVTTTLDARGRRTVTVPGVLTPTHVLINGFQFPVT